MYITECKPNVDLTSLSLSVVFAESVLYCDFVKLNMLFLLYGEHNATLRFKYEQITNREMCEICILCEEMKIDRLYYIKFVIKKLGHVPCTYVAFTIFQC